MTFSFYMEWQARFTGLRAPGQATPLGSGGYLGRCPRVQSLRSCILSIGSA